jgi:hypothetical protein
MPPVPIDGPLGNRRGCRDSCGEAVGTPRIPRGRAGVNSSPPNHSPQPKDQSARYGGPYSWMPLFVAGRLRPRCLELADDRMANSRDFAVDVAQPEDAEHLAAQLFAGSRLPAAVPHSACFPERDAARCRRPGASAPPPGRSGAPPWGESPRPTWSGCGTSRRASASSGRGVRRGSPSASRTMPSVVATLTIPSDCEASRRARAEGGSSAMPDTSSGSWRRAHLTAILFRQILGRRINRLTW